MTSGLASVSCHASKLNCHSTSGFHGPSVSWTKTSRLKFCHDHSEHWQKCFMKYCSGKFSSETLLDARARNLHKSKYRSFNDSLLSRLPILYKRLGKCFKIRHVTESILQHDSRMRWQRPRMTHFLQYWFRGLDQRVHQMASVCSDLDHVKF